MAVPGASGAAGGAADPANRAKARPAVITPRPREFRLKRLRFPASLSKKANPTTRSPMSSPARSVPNRPQAASGGPDVADVVVDAAGVAGWKMVLRDRSPTNLDRQRLWKHRAR